MGICNTKNVIDDVEESGKKREVEVRLGYADPFDFIISDFDIRKANGLFKSGTQELYNLYRHFDQRKLFKLGWKRDAELSSLEQGVAVFLQHDDTTSSGSSPPQLGTDPSSLPRSTDSFRPPDGRPSLFDISNAMTDSLTVSSFGGTEITSEEEEDGIEKTTQTEINVLIVTHIKRCDGSFRNVVMNSYKNMMTNGPFHLPKKTTKPEGGLLKNNEGGEDNVNNIYTIHHRTLRKELHLMSSQYSDFTPYFSFRKVECMYYLGLRSIGDVLFYSLIQCPQHISERVPSRRGFRRSVISFSGNGNGVVIVPIRYNSNSTSSPEKDEFGNIAKLQQQNDSYIEGAMILKRVKIIVLDEDQFDVYDRRALVNAFVKEGTFMRKICEEKVKQKKILEFPSVMKSQEKTQKSDDEEEEVERPEEEEVEEEVEVSRNIFPEQERNKNFVVVDEEEEEDENDDDDDESDGIIEDDEVGEF